MNTLWSLFLDVVGAVGFIGFVIVVIIYIRDGRGEA